MHERQNHTEPSDLQRWMETRDAELRKWYHIRVWVEYLASPAFVFKWTMTMLVITAFVGFVAYVLQEIGYWPW